MSNNTENLQTEIGVEELEKSNDSSLIKNHFDESIETPDVEELTNNTKKKTKMALEQLEMMIMKQSSGGNGLDISKLSEKQRDKVIDLMHKNEDNAFSYAKEKLRVTENLNIRALDASIVDQKTMRYILVGGIGGLFVFLLLILFFKEQYFVTFLSFITGLCGGVGLREGFVRLTKNPQPINPDDDDE